MSSTIERAVVVALCLLVTLFVGVSVSMLRPSPRSTDHATDEACVMSQLQTWLHELRAENGGQAPDPHSISGQSVGREGSRFSRSASRS